MSFSQNQKVLNCFDRIRLHLQQLDLAEVELKKVTDFVELEKSIAKSLLTRSEEEKD